MEIQLTSEITTTLVRAAGSDLDVVDHWRPGADADRVRRLVGTFLRERHHSPLEMGGWAKFRVHAPLFVVRQIERHRWLSQAADDTLGLSFAEDSGRYRELRPVFWVPRPDRALVPVEPFDPMRPTFRPASPGVYQQVCQWTHAVCRYSWHAYRDLLAQGAAREVARAALPLAVYVNLSVAGNLRAWLAFLALRTKDGRAEVPSHVQAETEEVGRAVEAEVKARWPLTWAAWDECGRAAP